MKGARQKMSDNALTTTLIHNGDFIYMKSFNDSRHDGIVTIRRTLKIQ